MYYVTSITFCIVVCQQKKESANNSIVPAAVFLAALLIYLIIVFRLLTDLADIYALLFIQLFILQMLTGEMSAGWLHVTPLVRLLGILLATSFS